MTEFCRGRSQDQEEIIDFINMVFSQNSVPHDFKTLLPKLYSDDADTGCCHFLAKEDGKIRAVVGLFPTQLHVGERRLKLGHIGSVSVHKYSRGKGYMKKLMHMAIEAAKAEGMDALVLGGLKNRYQAEVRIYSRECVASVQGRGQRSDYFCQDHISGGSSVRGRTCSLRAAFDPYGQRQ